MPRLAIIAAAFVATLVAGSFANQVTAFWPDMVSHKMSKMEQGKLKNRMWPNPYVCPDREWAAAPFETMIHNGWRQQNLLGAHHFNPKTNKLTQAGELKVRWVLTQAPEARRQVYVERDIDPAITELRLAAAQEFATLAVTAGETPTVVDTHIVSVGRPAASVDLVNQSYRENMLPAVLPASTGVSTGSGQ